MTAGQQYNSGVVDWMAVIDYPLPVDPSVDTGAVRL